MADFFEKALIYSAIGFLQGRISQVGDFRISKVGGENHTAIVDLLADDVFNSF